MPSLGLYKQLLNAPSQGQAFKHQSDLIMEATWYNSLEARTCWFFDYYHDNNKTKLDDLQPDKDMIPMDIKFLTNTSQTYNKDSIGYHIQLKPSQQEVVPYYNEVFNKRYGAHYPCGLYLLIPDSKGIYNKWLVVAEANYNDPQFPTFEVLRCNKVVQFIFKGVKYNISAVLRNQNS